MPLSSEMAGWINSSMFEWQILLSWRSAINDLGVMIFENHSKLTMTHVTIFYIKCFEFMGKIIQYTLLLILNKEIYFKHNLKTEILLTNFVKMGYI